MRSDQMIILVLSALALQVHADGYGLIGWGKTMYNPTCAFACRNVIKSCKLRCTPEKSTQNYGTVHSPIYTPPECFTTDPAFLRTMAVCIDTYCSLSDHPPQGLIDDYWASHLATTTVGNPHWKPNISYMEALEAGREDERALERLIALNGTERRSQQEKNLKLAVRQHSHDNPKASSKLKTFDVSSVLPPAVKGKPLNVTSFISPEAWQKVYNGFGDFEANESGHSTYSIAIALVALLLPLPLSLLRFIPNLSANYGFSYLMAKLVHPALWGRNHRTPVGVPIGGFMIPTRGQAMYIALISILNTIFLIAPYVHTHPQTTFASVREQDISVIGNRAGAMAMGNAAAMIVFAMRNNPLLWLTDWNYSTYQLLHRWMGYWTILLTTIHSLMLMAYYMIQGSYQDELIRTYWRWGIVATVSVCAILPASLLVVRQKAYELFLVAHIVFALLFVLGYFYHIWFCYKYDWGYEIWAYVFGGLWALERVLRLGRMALCGFRTATITEIPGSNGEYLHIAIEGARVDGVAFLCFPTASWRFWETHPLSVVQVTKSIDTSVDEEAHQKSEMTASVSRADSPSDQEKDSVEHATFVVRVRKGITAKLATHVARSELRSVRLRVLVEASYPSAGAADLKKCTSVLCIAGGVGITGVLHHVRNLSSEQRGRLVWGTRYSCLGTALAPALNTLPTSVAVETKVGERLDLALVLRREMESVDGKPEDGLLGIVVCGPPGMADDVRHELTTLTNSSGLRRPVIFIDEAFSW